MKRASDSTSKGMFTSVSFLKVLKPKITKNAKKDTKGKRPSAPHLAGSERGKR